MLLDYDSYCFIVSALMTTFPVLRTSLPNTFSINEDGIGSINETAIDANKASRNLPSCLFHFIFYCLNNLIN